MISWGYIFGAKPLLPQRQTSIISVAKTTEQEAECRWGYRRVIWGRSLINDSLPHFRGTPPYLCLYSQKRMIQIQHSNRLLHTRDFQGFKHVFGPTNIATHTIAKVDFLRFPYSKSAHCLENHYWTLTPSFLQQVECLWPSTMYMFKH